MIGVQIDGMSGWGCEQDGVQDGMVWGWIGLRQVMQVGGEDVKFGLRFGRVKSGLRRLCVVCATTETCCKCNKFIQNHAPGQSWLTPPITLVNGGIWRYIITKITLNDIENHILRRSRTRFTATHYTKPRFAYHTSHTSPLPPTFPHIPRLTILIH